MSNQRKSRALKRGRRWLLAGLAFATLAVVPTACGSSANTTSTTTTAKAGY
jgi:hypothetical protein